MWHETREEMLEMLKSIFRMDSDQSARRIAQKYLHVDDPDYYEFESKQLYKINHKYFFSQKWDALCEHFYSLNTTNNDFHCLQICCIVRFTLTHPVPYLFLIQFDFILWNKR